MANFMSRERIAHNSEMLLDRPRKVALAGVGAVLAVRDGLGSAFEECVEKGREADPRLLEEWRKAGEAVNEVGKKLRVGPPPEDLTDYLKGALDRLEKKLAKGDWNGGGLPGRQRWPRKKRAVRKGSSS